MGTGRSKTNEAEGDALPALGDVVAEKYVIEAVLGTGNMGVVVRARHKLLGQLVAIKFVKPSVLSDEAILARFTREARALVAMQSDHVVRVLDFGTLESGAPYMVMEHLTGHDLLAEMRQRDVVPIGEAVGYVIQACRGLADIHAQGVVHRDIKPANLFLSRRADGNVRVTIVDFGISKAPKQSEEELTLTSSAMAIGSPHYMAPEQLRDAKTVDHRADIWAIGVVLYRLLAGTPPFKADSIGALFAAVAADSPASLRDERPEVPEKLEAIVLRCLEKAPSARFASALELANALAPFASFVADATELRVMAPLAPAPPDLSGGEVPVARRTLAGDASGTAHPAVVETPSAPPVPQRRLPAILAIGAAVIAIALFAFLRGSSGVPSTLVSSRPSASVPAAPPAAPKTSSPEAAAAYRMAMQALRDASFIVAVNEFNHAATLDPQMAAAHLRIAINGDTLVGAESRKHFQQAFALRTSLDPRDLAILEAMEPLFLRTEPDKKETGRRLSALLARSPGDAEVLFFSMALFAADRPHDEALAACDHLLAVDPKFVAGYWQRAVLHEMSDEISEARSDVDQCLAASPAAASCLHVRAIMDDFAGKCAELEADAQQMLKVETGSYRAHEFLARALFARGYPLDAVKDALAQKAASTPAGARADVESIDRAHLAVLRGDFVSAAAAARAVSADGRAAATLLLIEIAAEGGDDAGAARIADAYSKQHGARSRAERMVEDPRPRLLAAMVRGGLRTEAERTREREEWLRAWEPRTSPLMLGELWVEAYGAPVATRADAEAALLAMPRYAPVHVVLEDGWSLPALGKIYALVGRTDDALPALRASAASCHALDEPFEHTRSELLLGEALATKGDNAGACAAYAVVIERWGHALPRSVTAEKASELAKAAGCARR